jgi:hypothetical protein
VQTWAIVVAAGSGARFGGAKQFRVMVGPERFDPASGGQNRDPGVVILL